MWQTRLLLPITSSSPKESSCAGGFRPSKNFEALRAISIYSRGPLNGGTDGVAGTLCSPRFDRSKMMTNYLCGCASKKIIVQRGSGSGGVLTPPPTAMTGHVASIFLASVLVFATSFTPVYAAPTTLKGSLDRLGVTTVGTGVADAKKYAGADLVKYTKQANDYAQKYSNDYTLFSKYEIVYDIVDGKSVFDKTKSTIIFSMPNFRALPIGLTKVTGDFTNNKFTRFEFAADKWYPDLEKKFAAKNGPFKGFIDLSNPKKPVVDFTAIYEWEESSKDGMLVQPLATLTYKMTAKENPGLGLGEFNPYPPGPVAAVPEPQSSALLLIGMAFLAWQVRRTGAYKSPSRRAGRS